ncbi:MAG TPA: ATP-binding protein, partial [Spirochaetota bacterium]|nr:ATP-binding protein [Spirochaetota bacterium]
AYFISAMIVGGLTSKLHSKEWALRIREKTISDIYEFSKVLENASDIDEIVITTVKYIEQYFHVKTAFILRNSSGGLSDTQHKYSSFIMHEGGRGIAEWVFKNRKSAGLNTDTLPQASASYIPLNSPGRVMGVLCIQSEKGSEFSFDQDNFFNSIVYQVSMKLERVMLSIESKNSFLLAESERIYKILLNSISHELRTPLTTITGASTSLLDNVVESKPEIRNALIREIYRASGRLNRLVDNLLDMSRLESGMMKLNKQKQDMGDLVSVVLRTLEEELSEYKVLIDIPDSLPMVNIDFVLMEQALINLVYNAVNHTPSGTVITISIQLSENSFQISVKDNGPGLIPEEIPFLFDKFQRGAASFSGGTGLGLSICKGIVDAHNGYVSAENNADGGAKFTITLPVETWN